MGEAGAVVRRRRAGDATRRRVLDAVVRTVTEVGYYKASSNEIARRAGVTWGAIQHLFGSREQLMLEVVHDVQARFKDQVSSARIEGASLEERLDRVLDVLADHYEDPAFLVEIQILLDLSVNPGMTADARDELRRTTVQDFTGMFQPLFAQVLGPAAGEEDLVAFTLATMAAHLEAHQIAKIAAEVPDITATRAFLVRAVAAVIRQETAKRGLAEG